jgi:ActR/RegA family two-component response regulator
MSDRAAGATSVLIAHPCDTVAARLAEDFKAEGYFPLRCSSQKMLRSVVEKSRPSLLVTELRLSDGICLPLLKQLAQRHPALSIIIVTGHESAASVVEAHRCGVALYMPRGATAAEILTQLRLQGNPGPGAAKVGAAARRPPAGRPTGHLDRLCWEYLNRVVSYAGSISQAAALLGLDRRSLRRMLSNYAPLGE